MMIYTANIVVLGLLGSTATPDILETAEQAIEARNVKALESMRFTAYGTDRDALSAADLIARLSECTRANRETDPGPRARIQISYNCAMGEKANARCESDTLLLSLDRASSPHVFAQLSYRRIVSQECTFPAPPSRTVEQSSS